MTTQLDPRIRKTRQGLRTAFTELLQEKPFIDISITDITKRADIARVTFYQHFDSKEALLLTLISDFFEELNKTINPTDLAQFMATGQTKQMPQLQQEQPINPTQAHLIRVALNHIGPDVRALAIRSFLQTLLQNGQIQDEKKAHILATYHVSGVLALLEKLLNNELDLSPTEFGATTLLLLRNLLTVQADGLG